MNTVEDFENAPVGATATSPDGQKTYRREARTRGGADWVHEEGDAALWAYADDLALHRYTLGPAPAPAPTTAREALNLAWNLAHPVKEGQMFPAGTELLQKNLDGTIRAEIVPEKKPATEIDENHARTLDPLPELEPDWLDAPAVLATDDRDRRGIFFPVADRDKYWQSAQSGLHYHWSDLRDVTPLYPKEDQ